MNARDYELDYGEGTGTQDEERWRNQEEEEGTDAKGYGGFEEPLGPDSDERDALGPQTLVRRKREVRRGREGVGRASREAPAPLLIWI